MVEICTKNLLIGLTLACSLATARIPEVDAVVPEDLVENPSDSESSAGSILVDLQDLTQSRKSNRKSNPQTNWDSQGTNYDINGKGANYTYRLGGKDVNTDCYGDGYQCPEDTWCQVDSRQNWYPWDVSYINRGRCLPYIKAGGACEPQFEGEAEYPTREDGTFYHRPTLCAPDLICTGDKVKVLPATCVQKRDPAVGCFASKPFCAGRPQGECAEKNDFCVCPPGSERKFDRERNSTSCSASNRVSRTKLEQCGSVFNSFNGPNFAFGFESGTGTPKVDGEPGLPNDSNIKPGETAKVKKMVLQRGQNKVNSVTANRIMQTLWPYRVCAGMETEDCTRFPLPVLGRGDDGDILDSYVAPAEFAGQQATWLPKGGRGVVDYHCSWMIMHATSMNGPEMLTEDEAKAFKEAILYVSSAFDCKVCRSNIVEIIHYYGLPKGLVREEYAKWFWQIHNHANEHTYATHSPSQQQIDATSYLHDSDRRWDMWANQKYMHPWYMSFADAKKTWRLD